MSLYLNRNEDFSNYVNDTIFIDKSNLITITNSNISKPSSKFMCITRPRRFGKQWPYLCLMLIILKAVILIFI